MFYTCHIAYIGFPRELDHTKDQAAIRHAVKGLATDFPAASSERYSFMSTSLKPLNGLFVWSMCGKGLANRQSRAPRKSNKFFQPTPCMCFSRKTPMSPCPPTPFCPQVLPLSAWFLPTTPLLLWHRTSVVTKRQPLHQKHLTTWTILQFCAFGTGGAQSFVFLLSLQQTRMKPFRCNPRDTTHSILQGKGWCRGNRWPPRSPHSGTLSWRGWNKKQARWTVCATLPSRIVKRLKN